MELKGANFYRLQKLVFINYLQKLFTLHSKRYRIVQVILFT